MDSFEVGTDISGQMHLSCIYCVWEIEIPNNINLTDLRRLAVDHVRAASEPTPPDRLMPETIATQPAPDRLATTPFLVPTGPITEYTSPESVREGSCPTPTCVRGIHHPPERAAEHMDAAGNWWPA